MAEKSDRIKVFHVATQSSAPTPEGISWAQERCLHQCIGRLGDTNITVESVSVAVATEIPSYVVVTMIASREYAGEGLERLREANRQEQIRNGKFFG